MSVLIGKLKQNPGMEFPLGRHIEHDSRSREYDLREVYSAVKAADTIHDDFAPVLNQKKLGGCVGFTGADILNTNMFAPTRKFLSDKAQPGSLDENGYLNDAAGIGFYSAATHADDIRGAYPPVDTGSSGLGLGKALKKMGLIDRYTHGFSLASLKLALMHTPVAVGSLWTNQMFEPDRNGVAHVGALNQANIAGGHEYSLRGVLFSIEMFLCRNHWTQDWNHNVTCTVSDAKPGEFLISFDDMGELLSNHGDVMVLHGVGTL